MNQTAMPKPGDYAEQYPYATNPDGNLVRLTNSFRNDVTSCSAVSAKMNAVKPTAALTTRQPASLPVVGVPKAVGYLGPK